MKKLLVFALSLLWLAAANAQSMVPNAQPMQSGAWIPALTATTTPGSPNYTFQVGTYDLIGGRQVNAKFRVSTSAWTGQTGNVQISGLPFANSSVVQSFGSCVISQYTAVVAASSFGVYGLIQPGASLITLLSGSANASANLDGASVGGTVLFIGQCTYDLF